MAEQLEQMVTDPDATSDYLVSLGKVAVGSIAVGTALGGGLWAARNSADVAQDVSNEGVSGFAFGGNL